MWYAQGRACNATTPNTEGADRCTEQTRERKDNAACWIKLRNARRHSHLQALGPCQTVPWRQRWLGRCPFNISSRSCSDFRLSMCSTTEGSPKQKAPNHVQRQVILGDVKLLEPSGKLSKRVVIIHRGLHLLCRLAPFRVCPHIQQTDEGSPSPEQFRLMFHACVPF